MARNEAHKKAQRKWYVEVVKPRREKWLKEHGPCVDCGTWENLEVDHVNPKLKVDHKVWSWSNERREAELAKCVVRCVICHRKKTNKDNNWQRLHGTETRYRRGCRCRECSMANTRGVAGRRERAKLRAGLVQLAESRIRTPQDGVQVSGPAPEFEQISKCCK